MALVSCRPRSELGGALLFLCAYKSALRATNQVYYWSISGPMCSGFLSRTFSTSRHRAEVKVEAMAVRVVAPSGWLGKSILALGMRSYFVLRVEVEYQTCSSFCWLEFPPAFSKSSRAYDHLAFLIMHVTRLTDATIRVNIFVCTQVQHLISQHSTRGLYHICIDSAR